MIGYLDKDTKPLVLVVPKMNGYVNTFKAEDKNNGLKIRYYECCITVELI